MKNQMKMSLVITKVKTFKHQGTKDKTIMLEVMTETTREKSIMIEYKQETDNLLLDMRG